MYSSTQNDERERTESRSYKSPLRKQEVCLWYNITIVWKKIIQRLTGQNNPYEHNDSDLYNSEDPFFIDFLFIHPNKTLIK